MKALKKSKILRFMQGLNLPSGSGTTPSTGMVVGLVSEPDKIIEPAFTGSINRTPTVNM